MKQIEKRLWIYMLELIAFCGILLFGIFYGSQYPDLIFWGFMVLFAIIIAIELTPTKKDVVILLVRMVALTILGTPVDKLVHYLFGVDSIPRLFLSLVLMAPIYLPLFAHLCKMGQKAVQRMERELANRKDN